MSSKPQPPESSPLGTIADGVWLLLGADLLYEVFESQLFKEISHESNALCGLRTNHSWKANQV
jgi:hypothetical protein